MVLQKKKLQKDMPLHAGQKECRKSANAKLVAERSLPIMTIRYAAFVL
jgi:hypothetical protein